MTLAQAQHDDVTRQVASAARRRARRDRRAPWVIAAAVALAYAVTLGFGFVWDDLILLDQKIRFYRSPLDAFLEPVGLPGLRVYRPLTFASYALDQLLWVRNPLGFHLTAVLLHAANAALVQRLALALGCVPGAALLAALLFAVHPVQAEAVTWVACRADLLATTFTLLALLALVRWRARGAWAWLVALAVAAFAAVASKETGVVAPLLVLACPRAADPAAARGRVDVAPRLRGTVVPVLAAALGAVAYVVLRPGDRSPGLDLGALDGAALAHLAGTFGFYVERLVAPFGLAAYVPEPPAGALHGVFAGAGVLGLAWLLAGRGLRRFGATWFLLALAPGLLVAIAHMLVTKASERYLYLPSVGLALVVAGELGLRPALLDDRRAKIAAAIVLGVLTLATAARALPWRNEIALWSAVVRHQPRFALPHMNLGLALADAGRFDEAERAYRAALAAESGDSGHRDVYLNLGHLQLRQGRLDAAAAMFEQANAIAPHASAYYGLGAVGRARARARLQAGDAAGAAEEFARARAALERALAINPRHYQSHFVLASVLYQSGDVDGAVAHYREVVALVGDTSAGRDAAAALAQLGSPPAR